MSSGKGRKQTAVPLKVKLQLLRAVDAGGASKTSICRRFGIPNSTLSSIIKNRERLTLMAETSKFDPDRKRLRASKYEELEDALLIWLQQSRSQNAPMFGPGAGAVVMAKANDFATKMGIDFKSNSGWLERFKKRKSINLKDNLGEKKRVSNETTADWETSLPTLLQNYAAKDIFKVEISAIFYSCLPEDIIANKDKRLSEKRLTAMIAFNSDGSEKLPVFVVYPKDSQFVESIELPVECAANETASMTAKIFTDWLTALDGHFLRENRKAVLVVDDCLVRPHAEEFKAVKTILLPTNRSSTSQPRGRQEIILTLKKNYRKLLLRKYLATTQTKREFEQMSIFDAMIMLDSAWSSVAPRKIEEWCRKKFSLPSGSEGAVKVEEEEPELELHDMFETALFNLDIPSSVTLDDYLGVDDDVSPVSILTDRDIIDVIRTIPQRSKESDQSPSNVNDEEMPNVADIHGINANAKSESGRSGLTDSNLLQFVDSTIDPDDSYEDSVDASEQTLGAQYAVADGMPSDSQATTSSRSRRVTNKRKRNERNGCRRGETLNDRRNESRRNKTRNEIRNSRIKNTILEQLVDLLRAADGDEDKSFLVSLLPTLKTFNRDQKLTFRSQVLQLVMNIKNIPKANSTIRTERANTDTNNTDPLSTQSFIHGQTPVLGIYRPSPIHQSPGSESSYPTLKYERKSPIIYDSDSSD